MKLTTLLTLDCKQQVFFLSDPGLKIVFYKTALKLRKMTRTVQSLANNMKLKDILSNSCFFEDTNSLTTGHSYSVFTILTLNVQKSSTICRVFSSFTRNRPHKQAKQNNGQQTSLMTNPYPTININQCYWCLHQLNKAIILPDGQRTIPF